jgi:DNA-binding PadR family transcriptional regulator
VGLNEVVLALLRRRPTSEPELAAACLGWFPDDPDVNAPRLGDALAGLANARLVQVLDGSAGDTSQGPLFALTEAGRRDLEAWLAVLVSPSAPTNDELVLKVIAAINVGGTSTDFLDRQRNELLRAMHDVTRQRESLPDLGRKLALDRWLAHLEADAKWLEQARAQTAGLDDPASPDK